MLSNYRVVTEVVVSNNIKQKKKGEGACDVLFTFLLSFFDKEKNERYLLLFPNILLMLSASPRMSGFIYQVK